MPEGEETTKPIDLSNMRVIDLSQNWDVNTPSFATYEGPTVKWIKRPAFEKVGGQFISSTLHVGTHLDAPLHFITLCTTRLPVFGQQFPNLS